MNVFIGRQAGMNGQDATGNTFVGYYAGRGTAVYDVYYNTFIGFNAGYSNSTGDGNIFIGPYAGWRQINNSNLLIVDSAQRADVATELSNAIVYGVMAAAVADQTLRINAATTIGFTTANALIIGVGTANIDYTLTFDGETNNGIITWMEDEDYFEFADDVVFDESISTKALSPAQILGNTDDWAVNTHSFVRYDSDGEYNLTGIVAGKDGQRLTFVNIGATKVTIMNQDANSAAANRFITTVAGDLEITQDQMVIMIYDATTARWRAGEI